MNINDVINNAAEEEYDIEGYDFKEETIDDLMLKDITFKNCTFTNIVFGESEFKKSYFLNCTFKDSDLSNTRKCRFDMGQNGILISCYKQLELFWVVGGSEDGSEFIIIFASASASTYRADIARVSEKSSFNLNDRDLYFRAVVLFHIC